MLLGFAQFALKNISAKMSLIKHSVGIFPGEIKG